MSVDLSTRYLGMQLRNPFVVSASPLGRDLDRLLLLEAAGAAAVVLPSLFEEQIEYDTMRVHATLEHGTESFAEALSYLPELTDYNTGPDRYLKLIGRARDSLRVPVIASLNGASPGGWTGYARKMQDAGAHALELNIFFVAADMEETSEEVERRYLDIVSEVRGAITIPLAVKVGPYFSAMASMARRIVDSGADGLVLFNRFYQPDIDLEHLVVAPNLKLSTSVELRLPLRWVAILYGRVAADLAITGGVHSAQDVIKSMMAGASVVMMASEFIEHGVGRVTQILGDLQSWMDLREYASIGQMKGSMSQRAVREPAAFERANYMKALNSFDNRLP